MPQQETFWSSQPRARELATVVNRATSVVQLYQVCDTVREEGLVADWVVDWAAQRQVEMRQVAH